MIVVIVVISTAEQCHFSPSKQGHHQNGDQAARRHDMMRSIGGHRFGCNFEGGLFDPPPGLGRRGGSGMGPFDSSPIGSY